MHHYLQMIRKESIFFRSSAEEKKTSSQDKYNLKLRKFLFFFFKQLSDIWNLVL